MMNRLVAYLSTVPSVPTEVWKCIQDADNTYDTTKEKVAYCKGRLSGQKDIYCNNDDSRKQFPLHLIWPDAVSAITHSVPCETTQAKRRRVIIDDDEEDEKEEEEHDDCNNTPGNCELDVHNVFNRTPHAKHVKDSFYRIGTTKYMFYRVDNVHNNGKIDVTWLYTKSDIIEILKELENYDYGRIETQYDDNVLWLSNHTQRNFFTGTDQVKCMDKNILFEQPLKNNRVKRHQYYVYEVLDVTTGDRTTLNTRTSEIQRIQNRVDAIVSDLLSRGCQNKTPNLSCDRIKDLVYAYGINKFVFKKPVVKDKMLCDACGMTRWITKILYVNGQKQARMGTYCYNHIFMAHKLVHYKDYGYKTVHDALDEYFQIIKLKQ